MAMRELFQPAGLAIKPIRPPALVPSPRVIYRTKRQNLSHEARVGRVDSVENLDLWHRFSRDFVRSKPRLEPELSGYLHNRGFLPQRAVQYGLPSDLVDAYVSDFQRQLLPLVNGRNQHVLHNRQLFWQVASSVLPLLDKVAIISHGRLVKTSNLCDALLLGNTANLALVKPLHSDNSETLLIDFAAKRAFQNAQDDQAFTCPTEFLHQFANKHDGCIVLALPPSICCAAELNLLQLVLALDPLTNEYFACGAAYGIDGLNGASSFGVEGATGAILSPKRLDRNELIRLASSDLPAGIKADGMLPGWWQLATDLSNSLNQLPVLAWVQLDILLQDGGYSIVDAKSLVDVERFQIHQPLLKGPQAIRFVREFGI